MIKRLWRYLQMMFPPHRAPPIFLLAFAVTWCTATTVAGAAFQFDPRLVAGAFSFVLFGLMWRVMDEFKDYELDCRLFPDRPLVTGMVTRVDLAVLAWAVVVALFSLNLWQGQPIVGWFLLAFTYSLLMFKFFFWPKVRRSLILALVTHHPVLFLLQCYIIAFHVELTPGNTNYAHLLAVAFLFWFPWTVWEVSRKIRAPGSEDDYETYSKIFGYRGACGIVVGLVSIIFAITVWVSQFYAGWPILVGGVGAATGFVAFRCARFARCPEPGKAPLLPLAEIYLPAFYGSFAIVQFLR